MQRGGARTGSRRSVAALWRPPLRPRERIVARCTHALARKQQPPSEPGNEAGGDGAACAVAGGVPAAVAAAAAVTTPAVSVGALVTSRARKAAAAAVVRHIQGSKVVTTSMHMDRLAAHLRAAASAAATVRVVLAAGAWWSKRPSRACHGRGTRRWARGRAACAGAAASASSQRTLMGSRQEPEGCAGRGGRAAGGSDGSRCFGAAAGQTVQHNVESCAPATFLCELAASIETHTLSAQSFNCIRHVYRGNSKKHLMQLLLRTFLCTTDVRHVSQLAVAQRRLGVPCERFWRELERPPARRTRRAVRSPTVYHAYATLAQQRKAAGALRLQTGCAASLRSALWCWQATSTRKMQQTACGQWPR